MKQGRNIKKLLNKFILNQCTNEETIEVVAYFRKNKFSKEFPTVEEVIQLLEEVPAMKVTVANRIYDHIITSTKKYGIEEPKQVTKRQHIWKYSIAASFVILVISSLFLYKSINISNTVDTVPEEVVNNKIILTLENGLNVILEDGKQKTIDVNGVVTGSQSGNQLIYNTNSKLEKLTYNELTVPYGKRFDLILSDGTKVTLNAGTSIKYPIQFIKGKNRKVYLNGEAYFNVVKDETHPFIVSANDINVRVLGTQFNMSNYSEDTDIKTVLVEGSIKLYETGKEINEKSSTILTPGHRANWDKTKEEMSIDKVDTSIYTAWIHGGLVFKNATFHNISKKLERHFDISIVNQYEYLDNRVFNASFYDEDIKDILDAFIENTPFEYSIKENTKVTITKPNH